MRRLGALSTFGLATAACTQLLEIPEPHPGPCSPDAPFVTSAVVDGISGPAGVQGAQLSHDERTIVFSRRNSVRADSSGDPVKRFGDLYLAHRTQIDQPFRQAVALDEINSDFDELTGSLSDDLRTLYFDRQDRDRMYRIFAATRPTPDARFGAPTVVALGDADSSNFEPFITADGLYFGSTRGRGIASLFYAPRAGTEFAAPDWLMSLEVLASPTAYEDPVVTDDELTIYFAAALAGRADKDIWTASRGARRDSFGTPHPVPELGSPGADTPTWISPDRCRLYFISDDRHVPALWVASRRAL